MKFRWKQYNGFWRYENIYQRKWTKNWNSIITFKKKSFKYFRKTKRKVKKNHCQTMIMIKNNDIKEKNNNENNENTEKDKTLQQE